MTSTLENQNTRILLSQDHSRIVAPAATPLDLSPCSGVGAPSAGAHHFDRGPRPGVACIAKEGPPSLGIRVWIWRQPFLTPWPPRGSRGPHDWRVYVDFRQPRPTAGALFGRHVMTAAQWMKHTGCRISEIPRVPTRMIWSGSITALESTTGANLDVRA